MTKNPNSNKSEKIYQQYIKNLKHSYAQHRLAAIDALGELQDKRAFEPILEILQNKNEDIFVREHAARTIGKFRDIRAVNRLLNLFRTPISTEEVADVTIEGFNVNELLNYLGTFLDDTFVDSLRTSTQPGNLSKNINDSLFHAAGQGLLALGEDALPLLFEALHDADAQVRAQVARTLCYVRGNEEVFEHLKEVFSDPDPKVRATVTLYIEQLYDPRAIELVLAATSDLDEYVRECAIRSLRLLGRSFDDQRILDKLTIMEDDIHPKVRQAAIMALKELQKWIKLTRP
jgi:HEAT repeat protein